MAVRHAASASAAGARSAGARCSPAGVSVRIARATRRKSAPRSVCASARRRRKDAASCRPPTSPSSRSRLALKNYYELLEIVSTASSDEVKRAFRAQIAKYHPDKVQHLGKEFQEMAAGRAAELTEAYRVLSNETERGDYDRILANAGMQARRPVVHQNASTCTPPPRPE